ncbi:hypothetical protein [Sphingomonas montanisoli]|uniref:Cupin domain-containing protein n=1 Tax=Sphingomonas montanisoli TaxID=2606412 RepID=A0A5D9C7J0_9SPHN|nr:hypothetical protein [Sphingomonas montanisoli]TZG27383.1 hypothetical protein FYJ91_07250 [Sphingomonas montanisoli]
MLGGPRIRHVDDVEEHEVVRIEYEDGRSASVFERFMEMSPRFMSFWNRWEPGMIQRRHGHHGDHVVFILKGEMTVGDTLCTAGSHIYLMHGDTFGPWIAGPDGCETLGVIAGEGSSFCGEQDMADHAALLASRGATQGAVPAIRNPPPWKPRGIVLPGPTKDA